jgi:divalent metal cation (Fe/Co/Zn/Cd) transporter
MSDSREKRYSKDGYKTLLASILLSSPGPLTLGIGLIFGHSSTQIADFVRRTAELMAIVVSFITFIRVTKHPEYSDSKIDEMERRANSLVGAIMCLSGSFMIIVALFMSSKNKGNVIMAFVIAFLGLLVNVFFWIRYSRLYKKNNNEILGTQGKLYGAKSLVDICVTSSLLSVILMPMSMISFYLDKIGSILVSLYLIYSGVRLVINNRKGISL